MSAVIQPGASMGIVAAGLSPAPAAGPAPKVGDAALLPTPTSTETDQLSELFALMAKSRQLGLRQSVQDVENTNGARKRAWQHAKAEMLRAHAERKESDFFHDLAGTCLRVAKVAAVVAAVAAAVGSGGAAAPVVALAWAGAGMSTAAFIQGETGYLQKLGMSDREAGWTELGLGLGGGAATGGALMIEPGISAHWISQGSLACAGVAGSAGGAAHWRASTHEANSQTHEARAASAAASEDRLERLLRTVLADIEAAEKSEDRTLNHLREAIGSKSETLVVAARRV